MTGLYVHVPFCVKKCPYCAFFSRPVSSWAVREYAGLLSAEAAVRHAGGSKVGGTVYIGGGTPTSLPAGIFGDLLSSIKNIIDARQPGEWTVEANPGTLTTTHLAQMREHGVTRISLGVQSFNGRHLKKLGRIHTAAEAETAFRQVADAGFTDCSLDLMFALPGQSLPDWEVDLRRAMDLRPSHISLYGLSLEEGTLFAERYTEADLPDEGIYADQYTAAVRILTDAGYEHYEISNFALPDRRCRHNMHYWQHGAYLGLGPGAHSFNGTRRWWNVADLDQYASLVGKGKAPEEGYEDLDDAALRHEMVFLALRTADGLDAQAFNIRFGDDFFTRYDRVLEKYTQAGCLVADTGRVRLTEKGFLVANEVFADFG